METKGEWSACVNKLTKRGGPPIPFDQFGMLNRIMNAMSKEEKAQKIPRTER
jgi:hypothetical protein